MEGLEDEGECDVVHRHLLVTGTDPHGTNVVDVAADGDPFGIECEILVRKRRFGTQSICVLRLYASFSLSLRIRGLI